MALGSIFNLEKNIYFQSKIQQMKEMDCDNYSLIKKINFGFIENIFKLNVG
jgi:hypothetical protein